MNLFTPEREKANTKKGDIRPFCILTYLSGLSPLYGNTTSDFYVIPPETTTTHPQALSNRPPSHLSLQASRWLPETPIASRRSVDAHAPDMKNDESTRRCQRLESRRYRSPWLFVLHSVVPALRLVFPVSSRHRLRPPTEPLSIRFRWRMPNA